MKLRNSERSRGAALGITGLIPVRLALFALSVALVAVIATVVTRLVVPPSPSPFHQLVMVKNLLLPILEILVYAVLVRRLEHRSASEVAVGRGGMVFMGLGLILGAALIAGVILTLSYWAVASIKYGTGAEGLLAEILVPFTTAVIEEIVFRAIVFRMAEAMFGTTLAALLSSLLFALAHLGNPGATGVTTLFLALDMGVLLAVAFAASRSLWLPIGLHMGWNIGLGYVFGVANSGVFDPHSLLRTTLAGPAWLSGGTFGLESSVVTLTFSVLLSGALALVAQRRGLWRPVSFRWRSED